MPVAHVLSPSKETKQNTKKPSDVPTPLGLKIAKTTFAAIVDNLVPLVGVPALALAASRLKQAKESGELAKLSAKLGKTKVEADASALLVAVVAAAFVVGIILRWRKASRSTYLVDFYTFRPPDRNQTSHEELRKGIRMSGVRSEERGLSCSSFVSGFSSSSSFLSLFPRPRRFLSRG